MKDLREYDLQFGPYPIRCYEAGAGRPLLLIHGIGPGTSVKANFSSILGPLSERYRVYASDFVGFGGSGRKVELPYFDFPLWIRQVQFLLDRIPEGPVGIIGHSMGGAIALKIAAANPRVDKVVTSGASGGTLRMNAAVDAFWKTPRSREDIRAAMKVGMHDHSAITDALVEERFAVINPAYSEYFEKMLAGDRQKMLDEARTPPEILAKIRADVLVMHGRNDLPCPPEETALVLHRQIPRSDLYLLANCGHAIPREYPDKILTLSRLWFG